MKQSSGMPSTKVEGVSTSTQSLGEKAGFETSGYIDKKGTPYGDGAMFNSLPPGMEISDQAVSDQRPMPMKTVVSESFPGDGW